MESSAAVTWWITFALRRLPHAAQFNRRAATVSVLGRRRREDRTARSGRADITPDKDTGIGDWKQVDIVELLHTGTKPDLDNVQGLMYEVIQGTSGGYKDMKKEDALAIAAYLKSLPPIKNKIK